MKRNKCVHLLVSFWLLAAWMLPAQTEAGAQEDGDVPELSGKRLDQVVQVSSSYGFTLALKKDGTVWSWGENSRGQLGNGRSGYMELSTYARKVPGLDNVKRVGTGSHETAFAIKRDGTVWMWGNVRHGLLAPVGSGDGAEDIVAEPRKVEGLEDVVQVALGGQHALALKEDGTVWVWGQNDSGQLGVDVSEIPVTKPVQVKELDNVKAVAASGNASFALKEDGTLWYWGLPSWVYRQKGPEGRENRPVPYTELNDIEEYISSSSSHYALLRDGTLWAWGSNYGGVLGDGSNVGRDTPVQIMIPPVSTWSCGYMQCLALTRDGELWAWGNNSLGQIGNGRTAHRFYTPVHLSEWDGRVAGVASGYRRTFILLRDGTLRGAGMNKFGEVGNGTLGNWYQNDSFGYPRHDRTAPFIWGVQTMGTTGYVPVYEAPELQVNGRTVQSSRPVMFINGHAYVELRTVLEEMGYSVLWDEYAKTLEASGNGNRLTLDQKTGAMELNGRTVKWSLPSYDVRSKLMVPVRQFADTFGWNVEWNRDKYRLSIFRSSVIIKTMNRE